MINDVHYNDFYSSNANRQMTITYSGGTLTNSDIAGTDGFKLIERICSERQLVFGSVGSAELRLKLLDTSEFSYIDEDLTVSLVTNGDTLNPFNFGSYKVVTDKPNRSGYYRELVAYDALYDVLNADYSSWYNGLTFPMTLKQFRDSFFTQIGITQEATTLPNDTMTVTKTITPTTLSGKDVLFAINEVNGRFGHLNRNGQYRYVKLISIVEGLYPADDLYPEDTLYPAEENTTPVGGAHVISANYESAYSDYISKLIIRNSDDSIGATIGSGVNEYVVQNNFLLYDKSAADLNTIGTTLYNEIALAYYQAATMKVVGNPCFELGDAYNATCKQTVVRSYILERTLVGIQGMTDTYVSHGELTLNNNSNVLQSQIQRLNGKTHELIINDEVFYSAIFDGQGNSKIAQNANAISLEVNRATGAEGDLSGRITVNENAILNKVSKNSPTGQTSFAWEMTDSKMEWAANGNTIMLLNSLGLYIKGEIEATSGKIANFTIGQYALTYGNINALYARTDQGLAIFEIGSSSFDDVDIRGGTVEINAGLVEIDSGQGVDIDGDVTVLGSFSCSSFSPSSISTSSFSLVGRSAGWEQISYIDGDGVTRTKWFLTG